MEGRMRKHANLLVILVLSFTLFSQEIQEEAVAINIEVPVRVIESHTDPVMLQIRNAE